METNWVYSWVESSNLSVVLVSVLLLGLQWSYSAW